MANRRDERMKEITDRLQAGLEELFSSEKYTEYLRVMSQFHHYSFNNTLLIALQRPIQPACDERRKGYTDHCPCPDP